MVIGDLLDVTIKRKASDLHLTVGYPPMLRVDGKLTALGSVDLTDEINESLIFSFLRPDQKELLLKEKEIDISFTHETNNRFRINLFYELGHIAGAFRLIPSDIRTIEELGLPPICHEFTKLSQGLILMTGPTGQGKTTSIAAILEEINEQYAKNIVT